MQGAKARDEPAVHLRALHGLPRGFGLERHGLHLLVPGRLLPAALRRLLQCVLPHRGRHERHEMRDQAPRLLLQGLADPRAHRGVRHADVCCLLRHGGHPRDWLHERLPLERRACVADHLHRRLLHLAAHSGHHHEEEENNAALALQLRQERLGHAYHGPDPRDRPLSLECERLLNVAVIHGLSGLRDNRQRCLQYMPIGSDSDDSGGAGRSL
mmetsp:Transcript_33941/g.91907  ORF Transcript_33941/g.91907 Transcript_33941/m.91907 type:complete len:213 (+) Transcript_33941:1677-2315(+)